MSKILVAYFSASGVTARLADTLAQAGSEESCMRSGPPFLIPMRIWTGTTGRAGAAGR